MRFFINAPPHLLQLLSAPLAGAPVQRPALVDDPVHGTHRLLHSTSRASAEPAQRQYTCKCTCSQMHDPIFMARTVSSTARAEPAHSQCTAAACMKRTCSAHAKHTCSHMHDPIFMACIVCCNGSATPPLHEVLLATCCTTSHYKAAAAAAWGGTMPASPCCWDGLTLAVPG